MLVYLIEHVKYPRIVQYKFQLRPLTTWFWCFGFASSRMEPQNLQQRFRRRNVHEEFDPTGWTVKHLYYKDVLQRFRKRGDSDDTRHYRQMDTPSWQRPMSHCPLCHRIFDFKRHSCGSSAPYLPNLTSCYFSVLFNWKMTLNIEKNVTNMLKTVLVEDFQRYYQKWERCLHRCVAAQGNYFYLKT